MTHAEKMAAKARRRTMWYHEANQPRRVKLALELAGSVYHRISLKMEVPGVGVVRQSTFTVPTLSAGI